MVIYRNHKMYNSFLIICARQLIRQLENHKLSLYLTAQIACFVFALDIPLEIVPAARLYFVSCLTWEKKNSCSIWKSGTDILIMTTIIARNTRYQSGFTGLLNCVLESFAWCAAWGEKKFEVQRQYFNELGQQLYKRRNTGSEAHTQTHNYNYTPD